MKDFDATKVTILVIVLIAVFVGVYFGYKAFFGGDKLSFNFDPLKNFKATAYVPISDDDEDATA